MTLTPTVTNLQKFPGRPNVFSHVGGFAPTTEAVTHCRVCKCPLALPTPFPRDRKGSLEARLGVGANKHLSAHSEETGSPKHPLRPRRPFLRRENACGRCSGTSLTIRLCTRRAGLWAGASTCPCSRVQADEGLGCKRGKARAFLLQPEHWGKRSRQQPRSAGTPPPQAMRSGQWRPHFLICETGHPHSQPRWVILGIAEPGGKCWTSITIFPPSFPPTRAREQEGTASMQLSTNPCSWAPRHHSTRPPTPGHPAHAQLDPHPGGHGRPSRQHSLCTSQAPTAASAQGGCGQVAALPGVAHPGI